MCAAEEKSRNSTGPTYLFVHSEHTLNNTISSMYLNKLPRVKLDVKEVRSAAAKSCSLLRVYSSVICRAEE